jgi:hypothetical protein
LNHCSGSATFSYGSWSCSFPQWFSIPKSFWWMRSSLRMKSSGVVRASDCVSMPNMGIRIQIRLPEILWIRIRTHNPYYKTLFP